jgi:hypothetical protein
MAKTKLSNSTIDTRDVNLMTEYVKNQERRNALHQEENDLLAKGGKLTSDQLDEYKKLVTEAGRLHRIAKELDNTNENILKSADEQLDSWSSLSGIYKGHKETLNQIALKTLQLKGISESIAKSTELDATQRNIALNKLTTFSDELSSITSKTSQLAGLTREEADKRAVLKARIGDEIKLLEQEADSLVKAGKLDDKSLENLKDKIQAKKDELKSAEEISSQYKLQKEVQEELRENLEGFEKTIFKVKGTVQMLFSGWQGASSLVLFSAGEIADKFGEIGKEMGIGVFEMSNFKTQASLVGAILGDNAKEAVVEMAKELGSVNDITYGMAIDAGTLAANYGLSGEEAAYMATIFGHISGNSDAVGNNTREFVKQLSLANGVMPSAAFKDIAENSEFVATYTKGTGENIGQAAVAAAKLGINLSTASKMTDHLLDYQSSVQDEMEASVLAGKEINLSKARELAYNGDIEGSLKAALDATGGIAEFNKMDPYARQATAKALGVSVGELQKMAAHQQDLNGMNGVGNQIYSRGSELLQYMGNTVTGKLLKGFGGLILGAGQFNIALKSMGTSIGGVVRGTFQILKNLFAMLTPSRMLQGMKTFGSAIKDSAVGKKVSGFAGGLKDKLMKGVGGGAEKAAGAALGAADKTESISGKIEKAGGDGKAFKDKAQNIADGIKAFADGKVFIGTLGLMAAAVGFVVMLAGIPGMIAVAALGELAGAGLMGLAIGLEMIGDIAATGLPFLGVGLIAAFGVSLIPLTYALSLLAPLVVSVGQAIATVFAGMANAFVTISAALPTLAANFLPLIGMILPIFGLAAAIGALSLSLLMLGTMGMIALPVLMALGALGTVTGVLGIGGGGGGKDKQDEMIALLQSIDSKVGGAPAIQMDSKLVTTASNNASARRGDSGGTKH